MLNHGLDSINRELYTMLVLSPGNETVHETHHCYKSYPVKIVTKLQRSTLILGLAWFWIVTILRFSLLLSVPSLT